MLHTLYAIQLALQLPHEFVLAPQLLPQQHHTPAQVLYLTHLTIDRELDDVAIVDDF